MFRDSKLPYERGQEYRNTAEKKLGRFIFVEN